LLLRAVMHYWLDSVQLHTAVMKVD